MSKYSMYTLTCFMLLSSPWCGATAEVVRGDVGCDKGATEAADGGRSPQTTPSHPHLPAVTTGHP